MNTSTSFTDCNKIPIVELLEFYEDIKYFNEEKAKAIEQQRGKK